MATPSKEVAQVAVRGISAPHERFLGWIATLRPGEGRSVVLFFAYAFLLLVCYYVLKTVREPLLLEGGSAALKSYATAVVALVLLVFVPLYGVVFRRATKNRHRLRDYAFLRCESRCFLCGLPSGRRYRLHLLRLGWRLRGHHRRAILGPRGRHFFSRQRPAFVSRSSWPVRRWAGSRDLWLPASCTTPTTLHRCCS